MNGLFLNSILKISVFGYTKQLKGQGHQMDTLLFSIIVFVSFYILK